MLFDKDMDLALRVVNWSAIIMVVFIITSAILGTYSINKGKVMKKKLYSDICWDAKMPTKEEVKALAGATAIMLSDKTNTIISVMPSKDGKPIFIIK